MTDHAPSKATYDAAKQMAADGYGRENIKNTLKVPERFARVVVFGKSKEAKAS